MASLSIVVDRMAHSTFSSGSPPRAFSTYSGVICLTPGYALTLGQLCDQAQGSDCRATAGGGEGDILYSVPIHPQPDFHDIPAGADGAGIAVGIGDSAHVPGVPGVVDDCLTETLKLLLLWLIYHINLSVFG